MSDPADLDLPPAPPAPPTAPSPASAVEPWQARLEALSLLLLASVAVLLISRLASASELAREQAGLPQQPFDLVSVVRLAGEQTGPVAAIAVVLALVLVTFGPGDGLSGRGIWALRAIWVIGLAVAGVAAFAGIAALIDPTVVSFAGPNPSLVRDLADRVSVAAPLLLSAVVSGYVAWSAFSTLGEVGPAPLVPDDEIPPS